MADAIFVSSSGTIRVRRGPRGPAGATGAAGPAGADGASGSGTIANTGNLIQGDGAGAGIDSTIVPADVIALVANNTGTNTGDQTDISGNAVTVTTIPTLSGDVSNSANEVTLVNIPKEATHENDPMEVPLNQGGWTLYEVSANDDYTGQTLQDITDLVSDELAPSSRYEIEAKLLMSTSADTTGVRIGIHGAGSGSAATCAVACNATSSSLTAMGTFGSQTIDSSFPTAGFLIFTNGTGICVLRGFVTTRSGGAPTISLQHLKVTSGTSSVLPGSNMRLRRCGF